MCHSQFRDHLPTFQRRNLQERNTTRKLRETELSLVRSGRRGIANSRRLRTRGSNNEGRTTAANVTD
jgi:hypothetical protein